MRGTPYKPINSPTSLGIIPAYAGNTCSSASAVCPSRDHPRVCGEHAPSVYAVGALTGSSPRMRGTRLLLQLVCLHCGIIPAYAGNTSTQRGTWFLSRDHPRVCGEHRYDQERCPRRSGSSPRMWGTLLVFRRARRRGGIIPAYAGNTLVSRLSIPLLWDHPRVCGEHGRIVRFRSFRQGSSPRMRGTHLRCYTLP